MYLAYVLWHPQVQDVTEKALKTSPYNAVAYGVLVVILILAVIFLWREYKNTLEVQRNIVNKAIGLIQLVEAKLDTVENVERETENLKENIEDLNKKVNQLSRDINRLE